MDEKTYKQWWQLHLRVAKGDSLKPDEQIEYDRGLRELDEEEKEQLNLDSLTTLRQLKKQVEQLRASHAQLRDKSARLDKKIANLEETYQAVTGYTLLTEPYGAP